MPNHVAFWFLRAFFADCNGAPFRSDQEGRCSRFFVVSTPNIPQKGLFWGFMAAHLIFVSKQLFFWCTITHLNGGGATRHTGYCSQLDKLLTYVFSVTSLDIFNISRCYTWFFCFDNPPLHFCLYTSLYPNILCSICLILCIMLTILCSFSGFFIIFNLFSILCPKLWNNKFKWTPYANSATGLYFSLQLTHRILVACLFAKKQHFSPLYTA